MKYKLLFFVVLTTSMSACAQANNSGNIGTTTAADTAKIDTRPAYIRFPTIPPFNLIGVDSTKLTRDDIKKHEPTIIMFFSPSCEHCQHQMDDFMAHNRALRKCQIVMATYQPYEEMVNFYKKYNVASHKNIHIGRDAKFVIPPFYRIRSLPFLALYGKNGQLITTFEGTTPVSKLLDAFHKG